MRGPQSLYFNSSYDSVIEYIGGVSNIVKVVWKVTLKLNKRKGVQTAGS